MKVRSASAVLAFALALACASAVFLGFASAQAQPHQNTTTYNISTEINMTERYINMVNKSAYIIFYPNLTSAYSYLEKAKNISRSDPAYASELLYDARRSAGEQLASIYRYRNESVLALSVVAVILAIALYWYMRPVTKAKKAKRR
ncbi:MAG: hypothetical protein ACP5K5_03400 [Candidatus Micrarchaeia archaeon]